MDATERSFVNVTKIDAARAQLQEAITLFFEQRSAIAIHTLVLASHQLLHDYTGRKMSMLKNEQTVLNYGKERIHRFNKEFNFFKHSKDDRDRLLKFDPELHTFFLADALHLFSEATGEWPHAHKVFNFWFILKHPHMVQAEQAVATVKIANQSGWCHKNMGTFLLLLTRPELF